MNDSIILLQQITEKDFTNISSQQLDSLLDFMLDHIGNDDSYIRDTLIYTGFCELILNDHLSNAQLTKLALTCIDNNHLYFENKNDAVLTRSFSALAIALLLYRDQNASFLNEGMAVEVLKKSIGYLNFEHDYRGYIEGKGWAHSIAHGSDLLAQAVAHPLFSKVASVEEGMEIVQKCLLTEYAYIDEEDERMLPVIDALFESGLTEQCFLQWLEQLQQFQHEDHLKNYRIHWNIKKFMLSLYIHFISKRQYESITNWLLKTYLNKK